MNFTAVLKIRIRMDPHQSYKLDPCPHLSDNWIRIRIKVISWIRIRIKVISWIRIQIGINLQMTSQNVPYEILDYLSTFSRF
jgi:hypothetical protein